MPQAANSRCRLCQVIFVIDKAPKVPPHNAITEHAAGYKSQTRITKRFARLNMHGCDIGEK